MPEDRLLPINEVDRMCVILRCDLLTGVCAETEGGAGYVECYKAMCYYCEQTVSERVCSCLGELVVMGLCVW